MQEVNEKLKTNKEYGDKAKRNITINWKNKKLITSAGIRGSSNNTFSSIAIYNAIPKYFTANK